MDVFALLFIVSFLAVVIALAVMYIHKCVKAKDNVAKVDKYVEYVPDIQVKWKETLPKHITRIKLRNSRKLRNKRKGKK